MVEIVERSTGRGFHAITNRITTIMKIEETIISQKARPTPPTVGIYHNILTRCMRKGKPMGQNLCIRSINHNVTGTLISKNSLDRLAMIEDKENQ